MTLGRRQIEEAPHSRFMGVEAHLVQVAIAISAMSSYLASMIAGAQSSSAPAYFVSCSAESTRIGFLIANGLLTIFPFGPLLSRAMFPVGERRPGVHRR